jgi:large subunit ribosomal protein L25
MKTIEIKGHLRGSLGSKDAKQLRREGQVPCVVYGGAENKHFTVDHQELRKAIYTPNVYLVNLDIDGARVDAIIRDAQFHPVSDKILHIDFTEVIAGQPIVVQLPVRLEGSAVGVRAGGTLRQNAMKLKVRGVTTGLPDEITLDISDLAIGDMIKVSEVKLNGVEFMEAPHRAIVAVKTTRKAVAEEPVAGAAAAAPAAAPAATAEKSE